MRTWGCVGIDRVCHYSRRHLPIRRRMPSPSRPAESAESAGHASAAPRRIGWSCRRRLPASASTPRWRWRCRSTRAAGCGPGSTAAGCPSTATPAVATRRVRGGEDGRRPGHPRHRRRSAYAPEPIALAIVYEDDALLVVDKPAGLVVHPGSGNRDGTLLNALLHHAPALAAMPRAGIVHRLDKDTSGLLVVARTLQAQTDLVRQLQARSVRREYAGARARRPRPRRHRRRADRPPPDAAHDDGRRRGRQARAHALRRARALRRRDAARLPPRDRAHAPDPRPPGVDRPSAGRRSGVRPTAAGPPFPARRCTRDGWVSSIR